MREEDPIRVNFAADIPSLTEIATSLQDISEGLSMIVNYLAMLTDLDAAKRKCSLRITGHIYNTEDRE